MFNLSSILQWKTFPSLFDVVLVFVVLTQTEKNTISLAQSVDIFIHFQKGKEGCKTNFEIQ